MLTQDKNRKERALAWTHGFGRREGRLADHELEFVVAVVSLADLESISYGAVATAEASLGWEPSIYWYVGTAVDGFGKNVVAEWNPSATQPPEMIGVASCLPFDSGGAALGRFSIPGQDMFELIATELKSIDNWHQIVLGSLRSAYSKFASYVDGDEPDKGPLGKVTIPVGADRRSHIWEVRAEKALYQTVVGPPSTIVWRDNTLLQMTLSYCSERYLRSGEPAFRAAHQRLERLSIVAASGNPSAAIREMLILRE